MYGEIVPRTGGETHFCDMYGAYERLSPEWKARIANRRAIHNLDFSRTRRHGEDLLTEAQKRENRRSNQPIVPWHPETGARLSLPWRSRRRPSSACRTRKAAR
jgi:taurine dioxygenase